MAARTSISPKLRFEVFKRDSFTCQYCGRKAPDVLLEIRYLKLEVDHIEPKSKDGSNDLLNLITACQECNVGKSNRRLSDSTVLEKQRHQLENLQERREQLEMLYDWQKGLLELDDQLINRLADFWNGLVPGFNLTGRGRKTLRELRRRFEVDEIMRGMKISVDQYVRYDEDGIATKESVETAWHKVGGICRIRRLEQDDPNIGRLYYVRGILRNRLNYVNERLCLPLLQNAIHAGASIDSLEQNAKSVSNWTEWREAIESFIARSEEDDTEKFHDREG